MKLYIYTFVSEDKEKDTIKNEVFDNLVNATAKLINDYKQCLSNMDIWDGEDDEDSGYTHDFNITEEQIRAYITDDLTGETCVWTVNEIETEFQTNK